jgi:hypothetical protein
MLWRGAGIGGLPRALRLLVAQHAAAGKARLIA